MKKINALTGSGQTHPENSQSDISDIRKAVISGDWSAINNGICTLTDLGLRHNGSGLVWFNSGISVHEAESDTEFSGKEKISVAYHTPLRAGISLKINNKIGFVHVRYIDNYCHNIISSSTAWREFSHRKNGQPLTTFTVQIDQQERKQASSGWYIWRNSTQRDKYTLLNVKHHAGLIRAHERMGWTRENPDYLTGIIRDNAEFGRLMARLGYVQVRTRKITGRWETFWLYRSSRRELVENTPLRPQDPAPRKASEPFVQFSKQPSASRKKIAVDGKWLYVYADHIHFLTKKRHRVDGVRVQGYTALGVDMREIN